MADAIISTDAEINSVRLKEQASAPAMPASGYGQLYAKSDGKPYFKNDAGTEYDLTTSDATGVVESIVAGTNVTVDATDPANPVVSASGAITQTAIRDRIGTATYTTKMERQERVTLNAGNTLTLANLTAQSGMVTTIWLAVAGTAVYRDTILRVYVDGEVSPSIEFDIGSAGLHLGTTGAYSTEHMAVEQITTNSGVTFKFPIPFATSCKVDLYNPTAETATVFSQVFYTNDLTDTRRLKSAGITYTNKATVSAGGSYNFLNYSGGNGVLVWHSLAADGATSINYLESDINVTIDGEASPSIANTGTEDWFFGAFYYGGGLRSQPWMFVSAKDAGTYRTMQAVDFLALFGGIKFTSSIVVDWDCSESSTAVDISYLILYYTGEPSTSDTLIDGSGAAGNVPYWSAANTLADTGLAYTDLRDAIKLQGRTLASTAPTDGQVIAWNNGASQYEPTDPTAGSGDVATDTIWDAKGDLAVGTGSNTADNLAVGTNGQFLKANSATVTGLEWVTVAPGSGNVTTVDTYANLPSAGNAGDLFFATDRPVIGRDDGAVWQWWGPIARITFPPIASAWTWVNQGGATLTDDAGSVILVAPTNSGDSLRVAVKSAPATPYTITALVESFVTAGVSHFSGLVFRESGTGEIVGFGLCSGNYADNPLRAIKWTNATTYSADYTLAYRPRPMSALTWLRITDNGTNRTCSISTDGVHFTAVHTVGRTDFLTADQVGFYIGVNSASVAAQLRILSWEES